MRPIRIRLQQFETDIAEPRLFPCAVSLGGQGAEFGDGPVASILEVQVGDISIACNRRRVSTPFEHGWRLDALAKTVLLLRRPGRRILGVQKAGLGRRGNFPGYNSGSLLGGLSVGVSLLGAFTEMDPQLGGVSDIPGYYTIAGLDTSDPAP